MSNRVAGPYYSVKDQPLPPPSTYRGGKRRGSSCCCCCFAWICSFLVALVIIIGIGALVFWLVVRPKTPHYNVQDVKVSGLTAGNLVSTGTNSTLITNTTYSVVARNPNKIIGIYYDSISVNLETSGVNIGQGTVPPFLQGRKNTTIITENLSSQPLQIADVIKAGVLNEVEAGRLPLLLTVDVRSRVKVGAWKSPRFTVKVTCNIVINPTVVSGTQVLSNTCSVKVRK